MVELVFDTLYRVGPDGPAAAAPRAPRLPVLDAARTTVADPAPQGRQVPRRHASSPPRTSSASLERVRDHAGALGARRGDRRSRPTATASSSCCARRSPTSRRCSRCPPIAITKGGKPPGRAADRLGAVRRRLARSRQAACSCSRRSTSTSRAGRTSISSTLRWYDTARRRGAAVRDRRGPAVGARRRRVHRRGSRSIAPTTSRAPRRCSSSSASARAHREVTVDRAFRRALDLALVARRPRPSVTSGERVIAVPRARAGRGRRRRLPRPRATGEDLDAARAALAVARPGSRRSPPTSSPSSSSRSWSRRPGPTIARSPSASRSRSTSSASRRRSRRCRRRRCATGWRAARAISGSASSPRR